MQVTCRQETGVLFSALVYRHRHCSACAADMMILCLMRLFLMASGLLRGNMKYSRQQPVFNVCRQAVLLAVLP